MTERERLAPSPNPLPKGEGFAEAAARLAGFAGALIGWRPGEFWSATPAELGAVLSVLAPEETGASEGDLRRLMEMYPDG